MTKVRLSRSLLQYRQAMAELINEVRHEKAVTALGRPKEGEVVLPRTDAAELWMPGVLRPPKIELLWPEICLKDGHLDGLIQINTSEYFGVENVYLSLKDDQGNHLESDYALDNEDVENHWGYFPSAPASPGTTIIVCAIAIDRLGGVAVKAEIIIV